MSAELGLYQFQQENEARHNEPEKKIENLHMKAFKQSYSHQSLGDREIQKHQR